MAMHIMRVDMYMFIMYRHIYLCVLMSADIYVWAYPCIYLWVCIYTYLFVDIHTYMNIHMCLCGYVHVYICVWHIHMCIYMW